MEEIKPTWKLAWGLWWRMLLFSLALAVIFYIPLVMILLALGVGLY